MGSKGGRIHIPWKKYKETRIAKALAGFLVVYNGCTETNILRQFVSRWPKVTERLLGRARDFEWLAGFIQAKKPDAELTAHILYDRGDKSVRQEEWPPETKAVVKALGVPWREFVTRRDELNAKMNSQKVSKRKLQKLLDPVVLAKDMRKTAANLEKFALSILAARERMQADEKKKKKKKRT